MAWLGGFAPLMIYVILGMHKSGTTLVSQLLHRSGIDMGEDFENGKSYDQGNQWERREAFLINLGLVGCREEDYFSLDHYREVESPLQPAQEKAMRAMLDSMGAASGSWGFKEPLTCLTYKQWRQVLPPHRVIGVYRNPAEVINHYRRPFRWRPLHDLTVAWRALRAWSNYNRGMLRAVEGLGADALLVRYEDLMTGESDYSKLQEFVEKPLVDVRSPAQYRARARYPFFGVLDRAAGIASGERPSRVFEELEAMGKR